MKKIIIGLVAIVIPNFGFANVTTSIGGEWKLKSDILLDGKLETDVATNSITLKSSKSLFIGENILSNEIISGQLNNSNLISFTSSPQGSAQVTHYLGRYSSDTTYQGVWYSSTGQEGDWLLAKEGGQKFYTCKEILDAGMSNGDGAYSIIDNSGAETTIFCDMTRNGGGWTLVGSYPKSAPGGIQRINEYGSISELSPYANGGPTKLWMFQGDISYFTDAREQVSCSDAYCQSGKTVFGYSITPQNIEKIRYSWAYMDRVENMPRFSDVPSCQINEDINTDVIEGCFGTKVTSTQVNTTTIIGWQADVYSTNCWAARGSSLSNSRGSSLCKSDPNGTKWALLWLR